ncbi:MAG: InlB B-repeat-containing protein [Firmicutes bacterium]|nr:InlB B-repeat-containing protein [Bacillota bacterium]
MSTAAFAPAAVVNAAIPNPEEMLNNPSFENGSISQGLVGIMLPGFYTTDSDTNAVVVSTGADRITAKDGSRFVKITGPGQGGMYLTGFPVSVGRACTFSCWMYITSADPAPSLYVTGMQGVTLQDANGASFGAGDLIEADASPDLLDQWQKITLDFQVQSAVGVASQVMLGVRNGYTGNQNICAPFYVDNFSLMSSPAYSHTVTLLDGSAVFASVGVVDGFSLYSMGERHPYPVPMKPGYTFVSWSDGFTEYTNVFADITAQAIWAPANTYAVTFMYDDAGAVQTSYIAANTAPGAERMPADPVKEGGYIFVGWFTNPDGTGTQFTADTPVTGDMAVYAYWQSGAKSVTFVSDDAQYAQAYVAGGASLGSGMPVSPSKTGYTFGGWFTGRDGSGTLLTLAAPVNGDLIVYAYWKNDAQATSHSVTFISDGAQYAGVAAVDGASLGADMPTAPSKTGYAFGGWFTGQIGTGTEFTSDTAVTGDLTVYAKWTLNTHNIIFISDGAQYAQVTADWGRPLGDKMPRQPSKAGYTFSGWFTGQSGAGTQFTNGTPVTGDITLYARWSKIYNVTFVSDGFQYASAVVIDGASLDAAIPAVPEKAGYTFNGCFTGQNGTGTAFTSATPVTADITVYAYWMSDVTETHNVTFMSDGAQYSSVTVIDGASLGASMPAAPTKTGYSFGGWFTGQYGLGTAFTDSTPVTGDITVYAKFSPTTFYHVIFMSDDAEYTRTSNNIPPGQSLGYLPFLRKAGYALGGWFTGENGTGTELTCFTPITGNLTVYAYWMSGVQDTAVIINASTYTGDDVFNQSVGSAFGPGVYYIGDTVTVTDFSPPSYTFEGWYVDGVKVSDDNPYTFIATKDMMVYALVLDFSTYIQVIAEPGGTATVGGGYPSGDTVTLTATPDSGYIFDGWYEWYDLNTPVSGDAVYTFAFRPLAVPPVSNQLIARFTALSEEDTVTFMSDDVQYAKVSASPGASLGVNMPIVPVKTGYAFGGWFTDENGAGAAFTAGTPVTGGLTVYALWTAAADKTALAALISQVDGMFGDCAFDGFTSASVADLKSALAAARGVCDDGAASQADTDGAYNTLNSSLKAAQASPAIFTLNTKSMAAKIGKAQKIVFVWNGYGAPVFTTSNPAVCGVTADGTLTPQKAGAAVITVAAPGGMKAVFAVTVTA